MAIGMAELQALNSYFTEAQAKVLLKIIEQAAASELPEGGSDGQVLTLQGGSAVWADLPEPEAE